MSITQGKFVGGDACDIKNEKMTKKHGVERKRSGRVAHRLTHKFAV